MELCLTGDDKWLDASRAAVVNADAGDASHVDEAVVALRKLSIWRVRNCSISRNRRSRRLSGR
jgi:hypothetical protein